MANELDLWEEKPAERFEDAHLLGNGRIGAAVFGSVIDERYVINEDTFWSGSESRYVNPNAREFLPNVRNLIFQGKYRDASDLIESDMLGTWAESYQSVGNLFLSLTSAGSYTSDHYWRRKTSDVHSYTRTLSLADAVSAVEFTIDDCRIKRESFVSQPHQALIIRHTASKRTFDVCLSFESDVRHTTAVESDRLTVIGRAPDHVAPIYSPEKPSILYRPDDQSDSLRIAAVVQVLETDGTFVDERSRVRVTGASKVVIALVVHTNYRGYLKARERDPGVITEECSRELAALSAVPYESIKSAHVEDYRSLFERVSIDIQPAVVPNLSTTKRVSLHKSGQLEDPSLLALCLQYCRYLLISSSREGTQAANLQGIWNHLVRPPWSSNYTTNINVQMNYWAAEVLNLSDCHMPLMNLIEEIADSGQLTAEGYYGAEGWACNHNVDLWRSTGPMSGLASWAYWPMAGGWLCQHLWHHFLYTGDREFLEHRAYPVLQGAAKFFLDFLVEDDEGYLSTAPSTSPENNFFLGSLEEVDEQALSSISAGNRMTDLERPTSSVCKSSTMDMTIIREVLENLVAAASILGVEIPFASRIEETLARLYPIKIGRYGQLQEWNEDFAECTPGMGHVSHMYGLYPGTLFCEQRNPEYYEACRKSMMRRLTHGGHRTHWPASWAISLFARLKEAFTCGRITESVLEGLGANMMTAGSYQLDCIFGLGAGIAEMLLQSHNGYIEIVPALAPSWTNGSFSGFVARGGFEIRCAWERGKLISAEVISRLGNRCVIRAQSVKEVVSGADAVPLQRPDELTVSFDTHAGAAYELRFE